MKVVSQTFLWQSMSFPMSEGVCSSRWRRVGSCCLGNYVNSLFVGCVVNWDYFRNQLIKEKKKKYNQCFWSERERENLKECFSLDCLCHRGRCGSEILLNLEITCAWGNIPALSPLGSAVDRKLDLKKKENHNLRVSEEAAQVNSHTTCMNPWRVKDMFSYVWFPPVLKWTLLFIPW